MSVDKVRIRVLGNNYLNNKGYDMLEELLNNNELEKAKEMLLGTFDGLWNRQEITDVEAQALYEELGISPEKASKLRQDSGKM